MTRASQASLQCMESRPSSHTRRARLGWAVEESDYLVILRDTPSTTAYTQELIGRSLQLGIYDLKELQAQKFLYSF